MDSVPDTQIEAHEELLRLRERVAQLEQNEARQQQMAEAVNECMRLAALSRDVSVALIQGATLHASLQSCAQALVTHLDAAFARIWTLNHATQVLELQASAGIYTHLDGAHSRVPVGTLKIGLIAAERRPHLTNAVVGDERVSDQEWARREGMVAFAGYPLLIDGELVGVMALFARVALSSAVIDAMASIANVVALGIQQKRAEEERTELLREERQARTEAENARLRLTTILDNLSDGFMIFDEQWRYVYINPQAEPYTWKKRADLLGKNLWEEFPATVATPFYQQYHYAVEHQQRVAFEIFSPLLEHWFDVRAYPIPGGLAVYFRNISERKKSEVEHVRLLAAEQQASAEAEAALSLRNSFLSSISHDLRTPLTTIKGSAQLLQRLAKRLPLPEESQRKRLQDGLVLIEETTSRMTAMVTELLDLAHLQAGQQLELTFSQGDLLALVRQVVAGQRISKRHHIIVETDLPALPIVVDLVRMERALTNLVSNAVKYSPQGGTVTIQLTCEGVADRHQAVVVVRDQGIGIPAADLPYIFEQFRRASNAVGTIPGTGVGLANVHQIVKQHDGDVIVTSEEGIGTTVTLCFPCKPLDM